MALPGDAVIVEVGLNEGAGRGVNPNVPITAEECAADALRCLDAGASIVHWHARDAAGEQHLEDAEGYAAALGPMRAAGLLAYPSYPVGPGIAPSRRLDHVWALRARAGLELVPIDLGSVSTVPWDPRVNDFVGLDWLRTQSGVVDNPLTFVVDAVVNAWHHGMTPTFGAFDVGGSRLLGMLAVSRRLERPVLHKVFLSEGWAVGPVPSVDALDWHLAQVPAELDCEWIVVPYAHHDPVVIERLCRAALERGGPRAGRHRRQPRGEPHGHERAARGAGGGLGPRRRPAGREPGGGPGPPGAGRRLTAGRSVRRTGSVARWGTRTGSRRARARRRGRTS